MSKPIRLSGHARERLAQRGISKEEIIEAIRTATWSSTELGRLECQKDFPYGRDWNSTTYATKQVRPIFVEETKEIVVVTVYAYYF